MIVYSLLVYYAFFCAVFVRADWSALKRVRDLTGTICHLDEAKYTEFHPACDLFEQEDLAKIPNLPIDGREFKCCDIIKSALFGSLYFYRYDHPDCSAHKSRDAQFLVKITADDEQIKRFGDTLKTTPSRSLWMEKIKEDAELQSELYAEE